VITLIFFGTHSTSLNTRRRSGAVEGWRWVERSGRKPCRHLADPDELCHLRTVAAEDCDVAAWIESRRVLVACCTCCAPAVNGRRSQRSMARGRRCTGDSSGGWARLLGGDVALTAAIHDAAEAWSGRAVRGMRRCTKRRWAGKKTGPQPADRRRRGEAHILTDAAALPIAMGSRPPTRPTRPR